MTLLRGEPELYKQYTKSNILHSDLSPSQIFCDGLFAISDYENALFLDIPLPIDGLIINGRQIDTQVGYATYAPQHHNILKSTYWKWDKYQGAVHGFLKAENDTRYTYVGDLRYFDLQEDFHLLRFRITPELPQSVVNQLSGFTWEISDPTSDDIYHVYDKDEAKALSHKIVRQTGELWLTNIDGQYITLSSNRVYTQLSYGHYLDDDMEMTVIHAYDEILQNNEATTAMTVGGLPQEIPLQTTISREDGIKALHEFIEAGQRPTCVKWRE